MIVEMAAGRSDTKRIALSVEYIQAVGISQFVKTCRKFQLHVLRWISSCVFSWMKKHMSSRLPGDGAKFSEAAEISRSGVEERQ
jgi:hypothetical protein